MWTFNPEYKEITNFRISTCSVRVIKERLLSNNVEVVLPRVSTHLDLVLGEDELCALELNKNGLKRVNLVGKKEIASGEDFIALGQYIVEHFPNIADELAENFDAQFRKANQWTRELSTQVRGRLDSFQYDLSIKAYRLFMDHSLEGLPRNYFNQVLRDLNPFKEQLCLA